ncbi:MAG: ATP-dependent DNA ligase [Candidatus Lokiarchaeota archaeon]|nr:ATP-dependent DNA ligase [Candidatus Lokiarchaeota archaeon]
MEYERLTKAYSDIENMTGNLEKIDRFAALLKDAKSSELPAIIALTKGKLHPDWKEEPEIGIAETSAAQIVAQAASVSDKTVFDILQKTGDIGLTAEQLLESSLQMTLFSEDLTIQSVYDRLDEISKVSGSGSAKKKSSLLIGLLTDASPSEAKYILRTITGDLRLGLGNMSIIDALSVAFLGNRSERAEIERAYNYLSDLPDIAYILATDGIEAIKQIHAKVGRPIRMMAAKKLTSSIEILEKTGGKAFVEFKYDGERMQIHKDRNAVTIFSRRQEVITRQYPDVVEYIQRHLDAETCIVEGECVAFDQTTGNLRPFQELMRRRRKTDIEETSDEVPVVLFLFDILFLNGVDTTGQTLLDRRGLLEELIEENSHVFLTTGTLIDNPESLDEQFLNALETGHEGVIAKGVHDKSTYQAGSRSWLWIKLKASYQEGMADSVDLVVVGAIHGRGKRTGVYGAILASAYDSENDTFPTVCKIGTGFTDEMLDEFKARLDEHIHTHKDSKVLSDIDADVWFEPIEVIEILGDEITISPTHPAGRDRLQDGGLAIRFPRFTGRWRDDKSPEQATTVADLVEMLEKQRGM